MHLIGPTSGNYPKSACVRAYQRIHSEFLCLPYHTSSFCSLSSRGFKDPRLFETDFAYVIVRLRIWRKRCNPPSYRLSGLGSQHSAKVAAIVCVGCRQEQELSRQLQVHPSVPEALTALCMV